MTTNKINYTNSSATYSHLGHTHVAYITLSICDKCQLLPAVAKYQHI